MKVATSILLLFSVSLFAQTSNGMRDTLFLAFNPAHYTRVKLSTTVLDNKQYFKYDWCGRLSSFVELVTNLKRSRVKINKEKIWAPSENYGISWFLEALENSKVIYIIKETKHKSKAMKVLEIKPDIEIE